MGLKSSMECWIIDEARQRPCREGDLNQEVAQGLNTGTQQERVAGYEDLSVAGYEDLVGKRSLSMIAN